MDTKNPVNRPEIYIPVSVTSFRSVQEGNDAHSPGLKYWYRAKRGPSGNVTLPVARRCAAKSRFRSKCTGAPKAVSISYGSGSDAAGRGTEVLSVVV